MITLRPATSEDAPRIRELVQAARINPTGLDWQRFIVATNLQGTVVGCGQIKPHRDGSAELASIVVDSDHHGQGLARALIERLIETHAGVLYLTCRSSLGEFYKKFGFEPVPEPQLPPYFRRLSRLAALIEILQKEGESLLVLYRPPNSGISV